MLTDSEGNAPKWWQWLVSGALIVVGAVLCATGVGTALGVGLLVAGGSMMASNIMSAAGVDGKLATIIASVLNIVTGVALMFTPFAAIGASMIGSGVGAIAGGYISEALGFSFEAGAMIGGIVGGIVGGQIYKAASAVSLASKASTANNATAKTGAGVKPATAASKPTAGAAQSAKAGQKHHYLTNKHRKITPQIEKITKKYNLDLNGKWNIETLPHAGRHATQYHKYMLKAIDGIDEVAQGSQASFLSKFEAVKSIIRQNPGMLYKAFWL